MVATSKRPMAALPFFLFFAILASVRYDRVNAFVPLQVRPFHTSFRLDEQKNGAAGEGETLNEQQPMKNIVQKNESTVVSISISASTSEQLADFAGDMRRLSILRPAVPNADYSASFEMVSAGSSYTRLWSPETWKRHTVSYPHERYLRHLRRWRYSTTAQKVFPSAMLCAAWAFFVSVLIRISPGNTLINACKGASAALGPLSAPIALLLTLRTNAALGRLNETRLAWGRLILYARSYTALIRSYVLPFYPEAAILSARHVAMFGWLLKSTVRGEDRAKELEVMRAVLGEESKDFEWLASHPKPVWAIGIRLRQIIAAVAEKYPGNMIVAHNLLEEGIANLEGVAGVCERILASPIPPTYSRHLSRVLSIWLAMLPFGLIGSGIPVLGVVMSSAFTSYVLVGLDELTMEIENCFSMLPLQQLAGAVQNSAGMQLIDRECCEGTTPASIEHTMPEVSL